MLINQLINQLIKLIIFLYSAPVLCFQSSVCGRHHSKWFADRSKLATPRHALSSMTTGIVKTPPRLYHKVSASDSISVTGHFIA